MLRGMTWGHQLDDWHALRILSERFRSMSIGVGVEEVAAQGRVRADEEERKEWVHEGSGRPRSLSNACMEGATRKPAN